MSEDMTIRLDGEEYVVRPDGRDVRVGRRVGGDVAWLDSVDGDLLPEAAIDALSRRDPHDQGLQIALRGIVQAEVERGG
jgi:hypothetical protein